MFSIFSRILTSTAFIVHGVLGCCGHHEHVCAGVGDSSHVEVHSHARVQPHVHASHDHAGTFVHSNLQASECESSEQPASHVHNSSQEKKGQPGPCEGIECSYLPFALGSADPSGLTDLVRQPSCSEPLPFSVTSTKPHACLANGSCGKAIAYSAPRALLQTWQL